MKRIFSLLVLLATTLWLFAACGRSGIDDYGFSDASVIDRIVPPDGAGTCGPDTCPDGCCTQDGVCASGADVDNCGSFGDLCVSCSEVGLDRCDPASRICTLDVENCGPANCSGCCKDSRTCLAGTASTACGTKGQRCSTCGNGLTCRALSPNPGGACQASKCSAATCPRGCCDGDTCRDGLLDSACGTGGKQCARCDATSVCQSGTCIPKAACNSLNCAGCCVGDTCVDGNLNTACGVGGLECTNCAGQGQTCTGGKCSGTTCGPATCPNGCCNGNTCVVGSQNNACGTGGIQCSNCTNRGQICNASKVCQAPCGPNNCTGCCSNNTCYGGFLNNRCGSRGRACNDCASNNQTCDVNQRTCTAAGQCPSTYGTCPANVTQASPTVSTACTSDLLQDARVACQAGPNSNSCLTYFQVLAGSYRNCFTCMNQFRYTFADGRGVATCAAPKLDATCKRNTGCATDCADQSCSQCTSAGAQATCRSQVQTGQCQSFVVGASCLFTALAGPAVVCNPATYANDFGAWLQGVGGTYCAP